MKVFIEENAWASCSYDLAGAPQQLVKISDRRVVGYVPQDRLLTIDDRATKEKFLCKLTAKKWGGLLALCGGIAVGLVVAFSGPVGWIVFAACAAVAVTAVGTAVALYNHDCSNPLKNGHWKFPHVTVLIQGKNAVLYNQSQLMCNNGGIVIASETQSAAQALSDSMKWNARMELGVQILQNALIGYITGVGVKDLDGDRDWLSAPLTVASYWYTDIEHAVDFYPEDSLLVALASSGIGYGVGEMHRIPWLKWTKGPWGTEFTKTDLKTTLRSLALGYGGDKLEQLLNSWNTDIANDASNRPSGASGKTIICLRH